MDKILIKQVQIIDPVTNRHQINDVLIINQQIAQVKDHISDLPSDTKIIDKSGLILGTGLVDLYSHSGEPGFEDRETQLSLAKAAIAGGFTRIAILPDTSPPLDHIGGLTRIQQISPKLPKFYFWGALTKGLKQEEMTELVELGTSPVVVGLSDGKPINNLALLYRILEYIKPFGFPIALSPIAPQLAGNGVMRDGSDAIRYGLPGNPMISETVALASILELIATTRTPVHIMRISTERSVELILDAKARGLPVTASTTWLHLILNTQDIANYNPNLKLEPPLGTPRDQLALIQGIKKGIIDAIAIDHTPYTYEEKTLPFAQSPPGAIGLELALPLLWQNLVVTNKISGLELFRALSSRPVKCLGLADMTPILPNQPAEVILFDPNQKWVVSQATLKSKSSNTSWLGQEIIGQVQDTFPDK